MRVYSPVETTGIQQLTVPIRSVVSSACNTGRLASRPTSAAMKPPRRREEPHPYWHCHVPHIYRVDRSPRVSSIAGQGVLPDSVPPAPDVEDGSPVPPKSAIRAFAEAAADLGVEPVPLPRFHDDVA